MGEAKTRARAHTHTHTPTEPVRNAADLGDPHIAFLVYVLLSKCFELEHLRVTPCRAKTSTT